MLKFQYCFKCCGIIRKIMKMCSSLHLIVFYDRNSRPDLKQRPNMNTDHWVLPHSFLSLLSYTVQDMCQGYHSPESMACCSKYLISIRAFSPVFDHPVTRQKTHNFYIYNKLLKKSFYSFAFQMISSFPVSPPQIPHPIPHGLCLYEVVPVPNPSASLL